MPRKPRSDKGKPRKAPEKTTQRPMDGVLVRLVSGEGNTQELQIQVLGDVKPAESPTLLRLAAQNAERQLGIG